MSHPTQHLGDESLLDNPIWHSLATGHAHLALERGLARRYPSEIGPLSGLRAPTAEAFADLATVIPEGDLAVLFLPEETAIPVGWQLLRDGTLVQMICRTSPASPAISDKIVPLHQADFPEMAALAALTEPGPFRAITASLGGFLGIRADGRLVAMAGQRLAPTGFAEISAVCTHPAFRGRGYAGGLVAAVAREVQQSGRIPFLTSFEANSGAIRVYEQVGFVVRRRFQLAVVRPELLTP